VSIGRGAFYDPWIFKRTLEYLRICSCRREKAPTNSASHLQGLPYASATDEVNDCVPPEPSFAERVRVMSRHLDLMIEVFGEELGCRMFRKVAPWYAKRFGPCHEFNKKVVQVSRKAQFEEVLANYITWRQQFLDDRGELQPRFQPVPMVASFMRDTTAISQSHIPVPKGPVEVW